MGEVAEHRLVQKLVPHPAVEAFHKAIQHRLARRDIVPFDFGLGALLEDLVRGQFCPIVTDDHPGSTTAFDERSQFPCHAAARERSVRDRRQTLARHIIDHVQHPEAPSAGELVMNEVERPSRIGPCLDQDRRPCPNRLAARIAFTDG